MDNFDKWLKREFGENLSFTSYENMEEKFDPFVFFGKKQETYPKALGGKEAARYTAEDGRIVLGLTIDIPTFDSSDREYDSWMTLYLMPGQTPGSVDGIYCRGGYRLASAVRCRGLRSASFRLKGLLKKAGVW